MVRRQNKKNLGMVYLAVSVAILFLIYMFISSGNVKFSAKHYDAEGNLIDGGGDLEQAYGAEQLQSLFASDIETKYSYLLQSTQPVKEETTVAVLKTVVVNPLSEKIRIKEVLVYKNNVELYNKAWSQLYLQAKENFVYETEPIELKGNDAQINSIRFDFVLEKDDGSNIIQRFEYVYFSLTPCTDDSDCSFPNNICDVTNKAGFSKTSERYCIKPCTDNSLCYPGQVCHSGYCGY